MWKDYLSFTKSERVTFWTLSVLMILFASISFAAKSWHPEPSLEQEKLNAEISAYFQALNDSVEALSSNIDSNLKVDLNIATSSELQEVGFNRFQASNILAFRKKGASFKKIDDVFKIYGMDSITYARVLPRVYVYSKRDSLPNKGASLAKNSKKSFVLELNDADTALLAFLPGIGPSFSARMVKFRESIGGFYNLSQLLEVYGFNQALVDKISPFLKIDTLLIRPLNINELSISRMKNHPYLDFYQAKDIYEFRKKSGSFSSINQLFSFDSFANADKKLIRRYFVVK